MDIQLKWVEKLLALILSRASKICNSSFYSEITQKASPKFGKEDWQVPRRISSAYSKEQSVVKHPDSLVLRSFD